MKFKRPLLLWFLITCDSYIVRLPCSWEGEFNLIDSSRYSINFVIYSTRAENPTVCSLYCVSNPDCTLANYSWQQKKCELIQDTVFYNKSKVVAYPRWRILTTNYGSRYRGVHCNLHKPCELFQICVDTCKEPFYECVTLNNVAMMKTAYQSSDQDISSAHYGVDGDASTTAWTKREVNPWWYVDLIHPVVVEFVTLISAGVSSEMKISIGMDKSPRMNELCATVKAESMEKLSYECAKGKLFGRYVYLYIDSEGEEELYFYQMEVYVM